MIYYNNDNTKKQRCQEQYKTKTLEACQTWAFFDIRKRLFVVDKILYSLDDKLGKNEAYCAPQNNAAENIGAGEGEVPGILEVAYHRTEGVDLSLDDGGVVTPGANICHEQAECDWENDSSDRERDIYRGNVSFYFLWSLYFSHNMVNRTFLTDWNFPYTIF